jgi:hypothetical protein
MADGAEFYVAPGGLDANSGAIDAPFGSFTKAISVAAAGDTIFARGGSYQLSSRIRIQKSGGVNNPINLFAFPGETPILDFSLNPSASDRGIQLEANWWHIKGLTVQKAPDNGMWISGSNNLLDQLVLRWNKDSGLQLSGSSAMQPANNLVLNTDSYENYDIANHGENADGFAAKFRDIGPGNVFRGNRAWGNSDDGWDFWEAAHGVTVEDSWAFKNGFNIWADAAFAGDGNGIKLGHDSGTHVLQNLLVWDHPANGVDVNGNATDIELPDEPIDHGVKVVNVTAYNNGSRNFRFDESYPHEVRNNVSLGGPGVVINTGVVHDHNSWNGAAWTASAADFLSLSDEGATGPRQPDGSLPRLDFLRLAPGSNLINSGVDVGLSYSQSAPDLGAYEFTPNQPADFNSDGHVDGADLTNWTGGFGATAGAQQESGDADGDADVDGADFLAWQQTVGGGANIASATVPEPTGMNLTVICAAIATGTYRRINSVCPSQARRPS